MSIKMYVWKVLPIQDEYYSRLSVENDIQIAIENSQIDVFIESIMSIKQCGTLILNCSRLPKGCPHSCDSIKDVWGEPSELFENCIFSSSLEYTKASVEIDSKSVHFRIPEKELDDFCRVVRNAAETRVYFDYEHFFYFLDSKLNREVKLHFWGWCFNGMIQFAT